MGSIKRYVVTRDGVEFSKDASLVIWGEEADPNLNEESLWDDSKSQSFVDELSVEEFKEEYNLNPPGMGSRKTMIVTYTWEEE